MSTYIGKLSVDSGAAVPVGSTLYGTCGTAAATSAKVVTLANFDTLIDGVTVHVKFTNGNSAVADNSFTLKVGSTDARQIVNPGGSVNWTENAVISFTYDETALLWRVNDGITTTVPVDQTYSSTSTNAISGAGVADALDDLGDAADKDVVTNIIDSGNNANNTNDTVPTTAAVASYVNSKTSGLTGAMHFVGRTTTTIADEDTTSPVVISGSNHTPAAGDVVLSGDHKEYVWTGSKWELLGDEGSYALKTYTENVIKTITFSGGSPTVVTSKNTTVVTGVSNSATARAASASVSGGVLNITTGILPTFDTASVKEIDQITAGSAATLSSTNQSVIVPEPTT